jgi:hypothetical protein
VRKEVLVGEDALGEDRNVVPSVALAGDVEGVLAEAELGVVFEEFCEEGHEVFGCRTGIFDFLGIVVVGEADADGLIDAEQVAVVVPRPGVYFGFEGALVAFDEDGAQFVEAAELAGSAWSSLQPDDEGYILIVPGNCVPLPQ